MFLDYGPTLKTVKLFAENKGLRLVYEADKEMPRTTGTTVYLPKPDPTWSREQQLIWLSSAYHEIRHNWPEFRGVFEWLKEKEISTRSFIGGVINCLEDFRIESNHSDKYLGEKHALMTGRMHHTNKNLDNIGVTHAKMEDAIRKAFDGDIPDDMDIDELVEEREKIESLLVWDTMIREDWQRALVGLGDSMYTKLTSKSKTYVDRLNAGDYEERMKQPMISLDEQYEIVKDIIRDVFKMSPEEEEQKAQQQYQEAQSKAGGGKGDSSDEDGEGQGVVAGKHTVMWEDLQMHAHGNEDKGYTSLHIDYSNHTEYEQYIPAGPDEINLYDLDDNVLMEVNDKVVNDINNIQAGNLDKQVRRLLLIKSKAKHSYGHKKGKLASRSLRKIVTDTHLATPAVFRKKEIKDILDTTVTILCDMSGSMGGWGGTSKYAHAARAAIMVDSAIGKLGVPVEILGFSDSGHLEHVIVKKAHKRMTEPEIIERFARAHAIMDCNSDGDSILWAYSRLAQARTKRKLLIVLSDGSPASCRAGDYYTFTKEVVKDIEDNSAVDIYGIGIKDDNVKKYYRHNTVVHEASQLENRLLEVIERKILN